MSGKGLTDEADRQRILSAVEGLIMQQTGNKTEMLVVLAGDGTALWIGHGAPDNVQMTAATVAHIRRQQPYLITHNHPNGYSFSDDDVLGAIHLGARELNVITPGQRFRLVLKPGATWPSIAAAQATITELRTQIIAALEQQRAIRPVPLSEILRIERHYRWTYFARVYAKRVDYLVETRE